MGDFMDINLDKYQEILQKEGYKLTSQRNEILKILLENRDKHLSSEEVYQLVSVNDPDIGIATVYRTLQLFEKINIAYKINLDDGLGRYELNYGTENHQHHHLICVNCGKIIEVKLDLLEALESEIEKEGNFKIIDHNVKFYGYCDECK